MRLDWDICVAAGFTRARIYLGTFKRICSDVNNFITLSGYTLKSLHFDVKIQTYLDLSGHTKTHLVSSGLC